MRIRALLLGGLLALGCGDDKPAASPPQQRPATPAAPAAGAGSGSAMVLPPRVEQMISDFECPPPREDAKPCDPAAVRTVTIGDEAPDPNDKTCGDKQYCLPTTKGYLCGECPERETIRHVFKDRDFAADNNRDPFQSFFGINPTSPTGPSDAPRDPANRCQRPDQMRVPKFSYQDLKLVGIVTQGTQRKVLMMDPSNYGQIIKRGDCVGKEKAWVKDIGENFICFEITEQATNRVDERCVELHTKQVTPLPGELPGPGTAPDGVAPPVVAPPTPVPAPQTPPQPTRRQVPSPQAEPPPPQPLQAPTVLNP
jgi:Tfp pilus assembly protein PilP